MNWAEHKWLVEFLSDDNRDWHTVSAPGFPMCGNSEPDFTNQKFWPVKSPEAAVAARY